MGKKSLAEQIEELSKPKKDFDIESNDFTGNAASEAEDSDLHELDDEELRTKHYVDTQKSQLRNAKPINLGEKYRGETTSRKDLSETNQELQEGLGTSEGSDLSESDSDHQDSYKAKSDGKEEEENISDREIVSEEDVGDDEDVRDDEDEDKQEEMSSEEGNKDDEETKSDQVGEQEHRNKLKEILANERKTIVGRLSDSTSNDALKGYVVMQQNKVFDSLVDLRLKIQPSLVNCNTLPVNKDSLESEELTSSDTNDYINKAREKCYDLLDDIAGLRKLFFKKQGENDPILSSKPPKRTYSNYLGNCTGLDRVLNKNRSSVLTKWSAKIQNSSGASALTANKFRAINQSAEQQVVYNLSDMERLVKRTKLNRRNITPLAYNKVDRDDHEKQADGEQEATENSRSRGLLAEVEEIYDDDDFYRVLLNDLVDKKLHASNPSSGFTISLRSAQRAQKQKKNIDPRASKGRKLKYHVQEPIANFETPRDTFKWDDNQIDEFFASLLGQKVNMNEIEESSGEEEQDEPTVPTEGSIKLFG